MNARRKGLKKESGQAFFPWALSLQSSLHSARRLLGLKGAVGKLGNRVRPAFDLDYLPAPEWGQHRPASMLRFALAGARAFQSNEGGRIRLPNHRGSRDLPIGFRVVPMEGQIVARTTTRLKVHRAFHLPELVRDIYCLGPRRDPLASRGQDSSFANRSWDRSQLLFLRVAGCRISPVLSEPHRVE